MVERNTFSGNFPGTTARQGGDDRADLDAYGSQSYGSQQYPDVCNWHSPRRAWNIIGDMVPEKETIPASFLSFVRQFGHQTRIGIEAKIGDIDGIMHSGSSLRSFKWSFTQRTRLSHQ